MLEYLTMANKSKPSRVPSEPSGARNAVLEKLSATSEASKIFQVQMDRDGSQMLPAQKDMEIIPKHTQTISKRFEEHYMHI